MDRSPLESDRASQSSSSVKGEANGNATPAAAEGVDSVTNGGGVSTEHNGEQAAELSPMEKILEEESRYPWPATLDRTLSLLAGPHVGKVADVDRMTRSPLRSVTPRLLRKRKQVARQRQVQKWEEVYHRSQSATYGAISTPEKHVVDLGDSLSDAKTYLQKINVQEQGMVGKAVQGTKELTYKLSDTYSFSPGMGKEEQEKDQLLRGKPQLEKKATFFQCVINQTNILVGLGMLGLPFVLKSSGWVGGLSFLMGFAAVTWRTAIMIGRCLNGDFRPCHKFDDSPYKSPIPPGSGHKMARMRPPLSTFPDIARAAFGDAGNILLSTVLYFELFSCLAICIVTMSEHMNVLIPAISITGFKIIMSMSLAVPTIVLRTPRLISYLSAVGMCANIAVISFVVGTAVIQGDVTDKIAAERGTHELPPYHILWKTSGIPLALGMSAYTFSGHATVPSIYTSMKSPQEFESMITCSFAIVLSCCVAMAVSGYWTFGNMVHDQVTISLAWIPGYGSGMVITALEALMVLSAFSTFTLCMYPIAIGIEELVDPLITGDAARMMASHLVRMSLLCSAMLVAIVVPSFSFICSLVGLITTMSVAVMFPSAAYVKLFGDRLSRPEKLLYYVFFVFGLISSLVGTYATVAQELRSSTE